jgi:hypothetical protein
MSLLADLKAWGKRSRLKTDDLEKILHRLHIEDRLSPADIGAKFDVPDRAQGRSVRFWLDAFGVPSQTLEPQIIRSAREYRFNSLADYFRDRWKIGHQKMSEELNVSRATVELYYKIFAAGLAELEVGDG